MSMTLSVPCTAPEHSAKTDLGITIEGQYSLFSYQPHNQEQDLTPEDFSNCFR